MGTPINPFSVRIAALHSARPLAYPLDMSSGSAPRASCAASRNSEFLEVSICKP